MIGLNEGFVFWKSSLLFRVLLAHVFQALNDFLCRKVSLVTFKDHLFPDLLEAELAYKLQLFQIERKSFCG